MPNKMPRCDLAETRSSRAFTLIELLTVIAIIGILAAILIPVVGAVRDSARASKCISNLRQMRNGIALYANDHNGVAPPPAFWGSRPENFPSNDLRTTFHYRIWEYVGYENRTFRRPDNTQLTESRTENIFHCPSTVQKLTVVPGGTASIDGYAYAMNEQPNVIYNRDVTVGLKKDRLTAPSRTVAVLEHSSWKTTPAKYFESGLIPHNGGGNFLFYDGHVQAIKFESVPKNSYQDDGLYFWAGGR